MGFLDFLEIFNPLNKKGSDAISKPFKAITKSPLDKCHPPTAIAGVDSDGKVYDQ